MCRQRSDIAFPNWLPGCNCLDCIRAQTLNAEQRTAFTSPSKAIRDAFAGTQSTYGAIKLVKDWQELPSGQYSAMNVNIAEFQYAVCSGAGGTIFFKDENLAKVYAAREINRGNELSMTICKLVPVARIQPKSLDVDITDLADPASGSVALNAGDIQQSGSVDNNG